MLIQRIWLFRRVWRDLPAFRPSLCSLLENPGRYRSVTALLIQHLDDHLWSYQGELVFEDCEQRRLHLLHTPIGHVKWLFSFSWMIQVTGHFAHRKHCDQMDILDPELSKVWMRCPVADRGLLLTQLTGVTYTADCLSSAQGLQTDERCPQCGQPDSRLHRAKECPATESLRQRFARLVPSNGRPILTRFPVLTDDRVHFLFSDGSWSYASAAISARSDCADALLWSGPLPISCQSAYRAEVFGLAFSVAQVRRAILCSCLLMTVRMPSLLITRTCGCTSCGAQPIFPLL